MKIKRRICIILAALIAVTALSGCMNAESIEIARISRVLSVNCSGARLEGKYDSHGGFHGDGTSFYEFNFDDDSQVNAIKNSDKWKPFPLTDNLTDIVWGVQTDDRYELPLVTRDNDYEHPLFPKVESGYWFFRDRHSDATDPNDDTHVLDESRCSYNFTVAIYDTDTDHLYYAEFDT